MIIGLIVDPIKDNPTGVSNYTRYIASGLINIDKKNKYVFVDYKKNDFNKKNLVYIKNPFKKFKTYTWHNLLPLKLKNIKLDLVFTFHGAPHFLKFKQKEVFFVYDLSWHHFPQFHPIGRVLLIYSFFKRTVANSYRVVVDSYATKDDLVKTFNVNSKKIYAIYPPLPEKIKESKKPNIDMNFPYILYFGTLEPRKNIESLVKAFKKIKDENI